MEPVFGNLLYHYGLRRVNMKGQAAVHKAILLSAVAYNFKNLLEYQPTCVRRLALVCQAGPQQWVQGGLFRVNYPLADSVKPPWVARC